ncbi:DUF3592 domain-containing protein [Streptomyces sp. NPDC090022]|uniref:DUF3592 domain-containing protein n=1 Tax=Streptomyces sp. NPDC090022 TaxID=3365920 RepID=UPI0038169446
MIFLPLIVPALILVFCALVMTWTVVRVRRVEAAWRSGIEAEGRCVGGYVVTRRAQGSAGSSRTHRHVYEFTTPDGRTHRFEEAGGAATTVPGDVVTVRHPEGRPDRATALPPGRGRTALTLGVAGTVCGLLAAGAVAFAVLYVTGTDRGGDHDVPRLPTGPAEPRRSDPPTGFPTDFPTEFPSGFPTPPPGAFPSGFPTDWPSGFPTQPGR